MIDAIASVSGVLPTPELAPRSIGGTGDFSRMVGEGLGALDGLPIALVVLGIGLSLGGPTGYCINPARDLGPRIMHFLLPIKNKRDSDWKYSWIPVVAPIVGALLAVMLYGVI